MALLDLFRRKPTVERFAQDIVAAGVVAGETGWRFEPSAQALVRDDTDGVLYLQNIFLEYSQAQSRLRGALLEKYVALLAANGAEIPALWTIAAKNVYAVLRSRYDAIGLEITSRDTGRHLPARVEFPWHGDLVVRIAYDFGASLGAVREDLAEVWGVSRDDLLERAVRNLCALPRPAWEPVAPGVFQLVSAASYEESMFLRDDVWEPLAVPGDVVALAPNRGVLLAAGSGGGDATVEALLHEARRSLEQRPWPLDAMLLCRRAGRWTAYEPKGRAAALWYLHRQISLAGAYGEQHPALQKHVGDDVWVATYGLVARKSDPALLFSYAVWTEDVPTLLPEVEYLAVSRRRDDGEFDTAFVPWDEAQRICGARMRAAPEHPRRWAVATFPDDAEWQALRAARMEP
jgi:hypothetical protein